MDAVSENQDVELLQRLLMLANFGTVVLIVILAPRSAFAGRAVIISDGTANASEQAVAAFMAIFPIVAVLVFALARLVERQK